MSTTELVQSNGSAPAASLAKPLSQEPQLFAGFEGAAMAPFDDKAREVLGAPVDPRDVEIRPDGIVYMSGVWYRRQLIRAFGAGSWALLPRSQPRAMGDIIIYHGALVVLGRFVAEAFGECATRGGMTYASALEGARTDCLSRCCKDLGMATELWDKTWIAAWKRDCAHGGGKDWKKNDGSEHVQAPLFTPPGPQAAAKEEAKASIPKASSSPVVAPVSTAAATASPGASVSTAAPSAAGGAPAASAHTNGQSADGKDYLPANKVAVKQGDPAAKPAQVGRIDELRVQCLDEQTFRITWLGSYKTHAGVKIEKPADLTFDQAANLIKRMTAHAGRQAQRMERAEADTAANVAAIGGARTPSRPPPLEDLLTQAFRFPDDEREWLRKLFGVDAANDLETDDAESALALLLAGYGTPKYQDLIVKLRAMGRVA